MRTAENLMEPALALAFQTTLVILTQDADQSASRTQTAIDRRLAFETNALTHAQGCAD